jgi:RNA polymerase sigma-70 factor (family 1)
MGFKSDKELVEALRYGDEDAFECLFERHWHSLYGFVYKMISDKDQTKDVLQNTFLEVWKRKETLFAEDSILPFLLKVAKNEVITLFRKDKVRLAGDEILISNLQRENLTDDKLLATELQDAIDSELIKMPVNMRKCFHLSKYEQMSIKDIATELLLSEQTVKNNISEALKRLRNALTSNWGYLALLIPVTINLT